MESSRELIQNLLLYVFQLKHDAEININRANGRQVMSRATAFWWFVNFRDNNTELNDEPRSGRPRESVRESQLNQQ